jgi:hypothetical protein
MSAVGKECRVDWFINCFRSLEAKALVEPNGSDIFCSDFESDSLSTCGLEARQCMLDEDATKSTTSLRWHNTDILY